ncbi:hypothetical protein RHSIM_Rhsim01G0024400 [Rhododendron simsii]|uniref:Uncharacterized protein n=1 Tax=Rhododendron simsii TaxID=118357 RepID=A0A834LZK6_RHOSS|nr:hypothetical protein RHSIM_Rhsim01G0024400 [Rhododendron simsii]
MLGSKEEKLMCEKRQNGVKIMFAASLVQNSTQQSKTKLAAMMFWFWSDLVRTSMPAQLRQLSATMVRSWSGQRLDGIDSEAAAQKLRGRAGTSVAVKLHNQSKSPALDDIDQVGITPDVQCTTEMLNSRPKERDVMRSPLVPNSCTMVAEHELDVKESEGCSGVQQTILVAFLMVLFRIFGIYSEAKDFTSSDVFISHMMLLFYSTCHVAVMLGSCDTLLVMLFVVACCLIC